MRTVNAFIQIKTCVKPKTSRWNISQRVNYVLFCILVSIIYILYPLSLYNRKWQQQNLECRLLSFCLYLEKSNLKTFQISFFVSLSEVFQQFSSLQVCLMLLRWGNKYSNMMEEVLKNKSLFMYILYDKHFNVWHLSKNESNIK